jgi:hypothetical protein
MLHGEDTDNEDDDPTDANNMKTTNQTKGRKKTNYVKESLESFKSQGRERIKVAESFKLRTSATDVIEYAILPPGEQIPEEHDPLIVPKYLDFKKEIGFDGKTLAEILFDDFLPSVTGHAKMLDKYHADI